MSALDFFLAMLLAPALLLVYGVALKPSITLEWWVCQSAVRQGVCKTKKHPGI